MRENSDNIDQDFGLTFTMYILKTVQTKQCVLDPGRMPYKQCIHTVQWISGADLWGNKLHLYWITRLVSSGKMLHATSVTSLINLLHLKYKKSCFFANTQSSLNSWTQLQLQICNIDTYLGNSHLYQNANMWS